MQENLLPAVISRIHQEIKKMLTTTLEGIAVEVDEHDFTSIRATVDGPVDTPYEGGRFKLRLVLGSDFPHAPPKGYFITKIFHPNVAKDGEICVNTLKRDWNPDLDLTHVLLTIKCLLIVPNPESALNEEAGRQLLEAYDDYAKHARLMTQIHAMPTAPTLGLSGLSRCYLMLPIPRHASPDSTQVSTKKTVEKAKKRGLKRL